MFYDIFYELCMEKGVTPTSVSRDIGIRQSTVSMWKIQKTTPNATTIAKLADYFDVSVDFLLGVTSFRKTSDENKLLYGKSLEEIMDPLNTVLTHYDEDGANAVRTMLADLIADFDFIATRMQSLMPSSKNDIIASMQAQLDCFSKMITYYSRAHSCLVNGTSAIIFKKKAEEAKNRYVSTIEDLNGLLKDAAFCGVPEITKREDNIALLVDKGGE